MTSQSVLSQGGRLVGIRRSEVSLLRVPVLPDSRWLAPGLVHGSHVLSGAAACFHVGIRSLFHRCRSSTCCWCWLLCFHCPLHCLHRWHGCGLQREVSVFHRAVPCFWNSLLHVPVSSGLLELGSFLLSVSPVLGFVRRLCCEWISHLLRLRSGSWLLVYQALYLYARVFLAMEHALLRFSDLRSRSAVSGFLELCRW